jgi:hypothetical protein
VLLESTASENTFLKQRYIQQRNEKEIMVKMAYGSARIWFTIIMLFIMFLVDVVPSTLQTMLATAPGNTRHHSILTILPP